MNPPPPLLPRNECKVPKIPKIGSSKNAGDSCIRNEDLLTTFRSPAVYSFAEDYRFPLDVTVEQRDPCKAVNREKSVERKRWRLAFRFDFSWGSERGEQPAPSAFEIAGGFSVLF